MASQPPVIEEVFPKNNHKTYTLVEVVPREGPMVGKSPDDTVFSFPLVLMLEVILLLAVTLAIFWFSLVKQAPLEEIANPMVTTDPAKAPWYFVGLQELLEHMHPTVAGVMVPTALVLFLVLLPYVDYRPEGIGQWFTSPRGKRITIFSALYTLVIMPAYILLDNAFNLREMLRGSVPVWVAQGLLPGFILIVMVMLPLLFLVRLKASRHEMVLALFTIMLVSAIVFTVSGFLFRGPGFNLYLPWDMPNGYNPWNEL